MPLICGHDAPAYGLPLCEHLRAATATGSPLDHHTYYVGEGVERYRICGPCGNEKTVTASPVCEECFDAAEGAPAGVVGLPETLEAPRPVGGEVETTDLPSGAGRVIDVAPTRGGLLLLDEEGRILLWETGARTCRELARGSVTVPDGSEPWCGREQTRRLHASRDGAFAAVVIDYGRHGEVYDLSSGAVTLTLENDGYHSDTVPFSLAFTEHDGRNVLLHRRQWSLIEAVDPATGEVLAAMPVEEESADWSGYFQGALHLSPGGTRIASDAWCWHPAGRPVAWNLGHWLTEGEGAWRTGNGWAALPPCEYYWNRPMAWLDEDRIVIGGLGEDEEEIVPGARVFDVSRVETDQWGHRNPVEVATFGGPEGAFFSADGLLFSAGADGLDIWDPVAGARTGSVPGFVPTHHDALAGHLLALDPARGAIRRWPMSGSRR
ncbi:hypothetical protein OHU17_33060 [Streptomyces goshikiensis]|uniref:WD40 repeat domain-containing protein n=1 Tax=Streptomyces goshikiensis TaxID=1942 RepID=A0ABZ1RUG4_9ACTN|nr:hypothetical protein [Streptomyces goshikiensis]